MNFKYYQYKLGEIDCFSGEMHASLHEIILNDELRHSNTPYLNQIFEFLLNDKKQPVILRKHLERGINLGDENRTRLITAPDFPLKKFESGYFNSKEIELGLSGGDVCDYKPNLLVEDYYFFWETKHPFSQWHKCSFTISGLTFTSTEQYMMYQKAKLFDDMDIAEKILRTNNVREQKKLGRQVRNFKKQDWNQNAIQIVFTGNKAKFTQNSDFLNLLLSTKGKTIVEASPDDNIWGIGLSESEEESRDLLKWKGTNWLGIVLTELREELLGNEFENGYLTLEDFKNKMI